MSKNYINGCLACTNSGVLKGPKPTHLLSSIKGTFYGDHLKRFTLRTGYLISGEEEAYPIYQNIRAGTGKRRLPSKPNLSPQIDTFSANISIMVPVPTSWFRTSHSTGRLA